MDGENKQPKPVSGDVIDDDIQPRTDAERDASPPIPQPDYKLAVRLDEETRLEPSNVTPRMAWGAIEKLELKQWVSEAQWTARKQFGQFLEIELTKGVMTSDIFETALALKRNVDGLSQIVQNKDTKTDMRIAAGMAASSAAKAYRELMDSLTRRVKEAKAAREDDGTGKPKGRRQGPPIRGPIDVPSEATPMPATSGGSP